MGNIQLIQRCVEQGLFEFAQAVHWAWPGGEVHDVHERNLTLYVAAVLQRRGFLPFAEATLERTGPQEGQKKDTRRIDLMAIDPSEGTLVALEAKHLFRVERIRDMSADVDRVHHLLSTFRPTQYDSFPNPKHRFGVIIALTTKREYAHWWSEGDDGTAPEGERDRDSWVSFTKAVQVHADHRYGQVPLWSNFATGRSGWGLYAVFCHKE